MPNYEPTEAVEQILFELIDPDDDAAIDEIRARLNLGWGLTDIFDVVNDYKSGSLGGSGSTTITEDLDAVETAVDTSSSSWLPTPFTVVVDNEQMTVTARTNNVLTVTRGVNGTTAAVHSNGAVILTVPVAPVTSVKVLGGAELTGDVEIPLATTSTNGLMSDTQFDKLAAIAAGATANMSDATIRNLDAVDWTGTLNSDLLQDGTNVKLFTSTLKTKLDGIAAGATVNQSDATTNALNKSWTGTLDANYISDNAGSGATDGRKYTKAEKDKVAGIPTIPGGDSLVLTSAVTTHKDKNDGTREHYSKAVHASTASTWGNYDIFGFEVHEDLIDNLNWSAGEPVDTTLGKLAEALSVTSILQGLHESTSSNIHGITNTADLLKLDANGVLILPAASTNPSGNPPAGSYYQWLDDATESVNVRTSDGSTTTVSPGWRNVYVRATADTVVTNTVTLSTCITCPENLVIGATYTFLAELYYFALDSATLGGIRVKWVFPTNAASDWSAVGPSFDAGAGTDREGMLYTAKHGTASSNLAGFGGQGAAARLPLKISGQLRMGDTAGAPLLQFAQSVAGGAGDTTTVKANSWMSFTRVA